MGCSCRNFLLSIWLTQLQVNLDHWWYREISLKRKSSVNGNAKLMWRMSDEEGIVSEQISVSVSLSLPALSVTPPLSFQGSFHCIVFFILHFSAFVFVLTVWIMSSLFHLIWFICLCYLRCVLYLLGNIWKSQPYLIFGLTTSIKWNTVMYHAKAGVTEYFVTVLFIFCTSWAHKQ